VRWLALGCVLMLCSAAIMVGLIGGVVVFVVSLGGLR
jgi:hypothetical protein